MSKRWLTISEAATRIPTSSGKRVSCATVWRWIADGCNGVKLEHARFGRRVVVSEDALDAFAAELARAWSERKPENTPTKKRTAARREQDVAAAEKYLRNQGVLS